MSGSLSALYLSNPSLAVALRRRQQGEQFAQGGMDTSPTSWAGALARIAQAYVGQRDINRADTEIRGAIDAQKAETDAFNAGTPQFGGVPAGAMPGQLPAPTVPRAENVPASAYDTSVPRPDRLNNPGALRFAGQNGATNVDGFAYFPTREAGMAAADENLAGYGTRHGVTTLAQAISRWAPPSENDTQAYINRVAQATGIDPNATINLADPAVRQRILPHMFAVEGGARSVAGGAPQRTASAPPPAADAGGPAGGAGGDVGGPARASPLADAYLQHAMDLQRRAQQAAASNNPAIRQQAPMIMQQAQLYAGLAKEKPTTTRLRPGDILVDNTGRTITQAPDNTGPLNVVQDGVDEKNNPRWRYATRSEAVGRTAPTPGPMVSTNLDLRGQGAEVAERGKSLATEADEARKAATTAAATIDQVRQLRTIGAETDRLAGAREVIGSALDALGVKGTKAVTAATDLQKFNGALSGLVLGAQLAQKGVQTEGDAQRMREQYAKATNTMEANDFLMRATEAQAARQMEKADFYERWFNEPVDGKPRGTYGGAQQAWNQFIRDTPLTIRGPNGIAFYGEAREAARAAGVPDEDFNRQWKERAARR